DVRNALFTLGRNEDKKELIKRMSLGGMISPCFEGAAFKDIDMPPNRKLNGIDIDGKGVVIGIIDDGCAFAHPDFLVPSTKQSRIVYLWDQTPEAKDASKGWTATGFGYGAEIQNTGASKKIDDAIALKPLPNGSVDEDAVYEYLGYK